MFIGMANVAGATKKGAMTVAIFIAYCAGNIVGPQLIKSQTKARPYPELWEGSIICYCIAIAAATALSLAPSMYSRSWPVHDDQERARDT